MWLFYKHKDINLMIVSSNCMDRIMNLVLMLIIKFSRNIFDTYIVILSCSKIIHVLKIKLYNRCFKSKIKAGNMQWIFNKSSILSSKHNKRAHLALFFQHLLFQHCKQQDIFLQFAQPIWWKNTTGRFISLWNTWIQNTPMPVLVSNLYSS